MKIRINHIMVIGLLIINIVLLIQHIDYRYKTASFLTEAREAIDINNSLQNNISMAYKNVGKKIPLNELKDSLYADIEHSSFFYDSNKILFCRISNNYCESCVHSAVERLVKFCDYNYADKIVFLCDYSNHRLLNKIIDYYNIRDYRVVVSPFFDLPAEYANFPYYFVADSSMTITSIYFPNKALEGMDSTFISILCKDINSK